MRHDEPGNPLLERERLDIPAEDGNNQVGGRDDGPPVNPALYLARLVRLIGNIVNQIRRTSCKSNKVLHHFKLPTSGSKLFGKSTFAAISTILKPQQHHDSTIHSIDSAAISTEGPNTAKSPVLSTMAAKPDIFPSLLVPAQLHSPMLQEARIFAGIFPSSR